MEKQTTETQKPNQQKPPVRAPDAVQAVPMKAENVDEAATLTPSEKQSADYGAEHFDLKEE